MTIARRTVVDPETSGVYHCISRCVRRAFLCGGEFEHRKDWVQNRLRELSSIFAIDVGGYAVMSNHLHVVVRTDPPRARRWSRREIARRWLRLFPGPLSDGDEHGTDRHIKALAADVDRIELLRRRLGDLSWFMRCVNERIARRANQEDRCTGRFWEGRFKCHALLDEAAVLACLVYVDLNVVRAGLATTPEESEHTSVQERIKARRYARRSRNRSGQLPRQAAALFAQLSPGERPRHDEDGIWLAPIESRESTTRRPGERRRRGLLGMSLDQYLKVVDATGRLVAAGKAGVVPAHLRPILERLGLDCDRWQGTMRQTRRMFGTAIGSTASLIDEAARRGRRWVVGVLDVHAPASE